MPRTARTGDPRIRAFLAAWHEKYLDRFGAKPVIDAKHARLVQTRLRVLGVTELEALRNLYFDVAEGPGRDERIPAGVSLGSFFTDWVLERLRAMRREREGTSENGRRREIVLAVRRLTPRLAIHGKIYTDVRCDGLNVLARLGDRQVSIIGDLEAATARIPSEQISAAVRALVHESGGCPPIQPGRLKGGNPWLVSTSLCGSS